MSGRGLAAVVAGLGLAGAVVAAVVLPALPLPVTADLRGPGAAPDGTRTLIASVAGRAALAVPAALALLGEVLPRVPRAVPYVTASRRTAVTAAAAPITVFLVAQVNGERDLGALVLVYAAAAAAVLVRAPGGDRAWSLGAALGVVPWGVVAFQQVGATLVGTVPLGVRVVTLLVLAASIGEFVGARRADGLLPAALPAALLGAGSLLL